MPTERLIAEYGQTPELSLISRAPTDTEATHRRLANRLSDLLALTKARVNFFVVGTAFVGFALHARILANWWVLLPTLIGTGLIAGAAATANQMREEKFDRQMVRTRNRPLATGRIRRGTALALAAVFLGVGCFSLGVFVNLRAMSLAGLTFIIYAFAYTPLKRQTPACILVGAIAGALPVLVGWAASGATFDLWAAVAFAVLFLWQIPHFLAIAWRCRTDYLRAGYRVLPCRDDKGRRTAGWALAGAVTTVAVTFIPLILRRVTDWYLFGELALGIVLLFAVTRFLVKRTDAAAQTLFITTLVYLPCVYLLMLLCNTQT
ncbi:MAG: heme o synthase [Verrucomicrobia bacterium]|nr:heme o synthase [Verrucomicrobiota bacterium]